MAKVSPSFPPFMLRSVRPRTGAELSRIVGDPDAVFARTPADWLATDNPEQLKRDNLRRFYAANHRLDGKPRHYRIGGGEPVGPLEWAIVCLVFAIVCGMMVSM